MTQTYEPRSAVGEKAAAGGGGGGGGPFGPAFQREVLLQFQAGVNEITGTVAVPSTAGLEIETVSADIGIGPREQAFLFVETTASGTFARHPITLQQLPLQPHVFMATHCVRLYADAGSTITVRIHRDGNVNPAIPKPELVTLSGRLR